MSPPYYLKLLPFTKNFTTAWKFDIKNMFLKAVQFSATFDSKRMMKIISDIFKLFWHTFVT